MSMRYKELLMQAEDAPCTTDRTPLPKDMVVGMAYVPFQQFSQKKLYAAEDGFAQGTIFSDLDKPFTGKPGDWK